jgi:hypothetical protein
MSSRGDDAMGQFKAMEITTARKKARIGDYQAIEDARES